MTFAMEEANGQLSTYDGDTDGALNSTELGEMLVPSPASRQEYARDAQQALLEVASQEGFNFDLALEHSRRFTAAFSHLLQDTYDDSSFEYSDAYADGPVQSFHDYMYGDELMT